jgi:hypothetical protein
MQEDTTTREFYVIQHNASKQFLEGHHFDVGGWSEEVLYAARFSTLPQAEQIRVELCRKNEEFRKPPDSLQVVRIEITVRFLQSSWRSV